MSRVRSRTEKAFINTVTSALQELVQLACGLILPRIILHTFGSSYNGITSSASQFLSGVSILTFGLAGSTRVALYKSLAEHDLAKTSAYVKAMERYMRKIGLVLIAVLVVLTVVYPLVVETGYSWIEVAPLIVAAGISASGRYFFGSSINALIAADQSVYISNILSMIANILNVVVSVILIRIGCGIQIVKFVSSLVLLMNPIVRSMYVRRKYHLDTHCKPDNSAMKMRRHVLGHSIANMVHDHTDVLVLTIFCNVKIVSVYTTYNLVMKVLNRTQRVFTTGVEAVFGSMWVRGETEKMERTLGVYEYILGVVVSTIFASTLVLILPFISLYTKGVNDEQYILPVYAMVITIAQMFFCFRTPYLTVGHALGRYKETKNGAYLEAAINLGLSVLLVQFIGIVGVAVGTLVANIFRTVQYAVYIDNHVAKRGKQVFIFRILWASFNTAVLYFLLNPIVSSYAYTGWIYWIAMGALTLVGSLVITAASSLIFYRNDMQEMIQLLKGKIFHVRKRRI